jgi:hypothetical protein
MLFSSAHDARRLRGRHPLEVGAAGGADALRNDPVVKTRMRGTFDV